MAATAEVAAAATGVNSAAPANLPSEGGENDASEALLDSSGAPAKTRAVAVVVKWTVLLGVGLGICFLAARFLLPFLQELQHPSKSGAGASKEAPTAVRMLQQTRSVVDANNVHAANVNEIAAVALNEKSAVASPSPSAAPVLPPRPSVAIAKGDLAPYYDAIARFKVGGVTELPEPRVYLDGRIVKFGEIIDRDLAIRFMGVDAENKMLLFTNADNAVFKLRY